MCILLYFVCIQQLQLKSCVETLHKAEARSGAEMSTKIIFLLLSSSFLLAIALSVDPPTSMKSDFVGRVAVVTGANKGIGYHIARQLAASGQFTDVVLACRDGARGEAARRRMESEVTNGGGSRGPAAAALTASPSRWATRRVTPRSSTRWTRGSAGSTSS